MGCSWCPQEEMVPEIGQGHPERLAGTDAAGVGSQPVRLRVARISLRGRLSGEHLGIRCGWRLFLTGDEGRQENSLAKGSFNAGNYPANSSSRKRPRGPDGAGRGRDEPEAADPVRADQPRKRASGETKRHSTVTSDPRPTWKAKGGSVQLSLICGLGRGPWPAIA